MEKGVEEEEEQEEQKAGRARKHEAYWCDAVGEWRRRVHRRRRQEQEGEGSAVELEVRKVGQENRT